MPDDGPYETLAGLVMTELGRLPQIGDTIATPRAALTVEAMEGRRVTRLRVRPVAGSARDDAAGDTPAPRGPAGRDGEEGR